MLNSLLETRAQILQGRDVVTLINTFTVMPGKQQDVIDLLTRITETTMRHLPGFISASVHRSPDGKHVANYVQWETEADFQAMFHNVEAAAHMDEVSALAITVLPILYKIDYVGALAGSNP